MIRREVALPSSTLEARVVGRRPLTYAGGADPALDRPTHVRAASGIARWGGALYVVQDDAAFLARIDPGTGRVDDVPLPAGPGGVRLFGDDRGNKADKLDLEALVALPTDEGEVLLGLGSGSTPARERVLWVERTAAGGVLPRLLEARALYAALRAEEAFAGAELNVEGAFVDGDDLVLVQRGNGDPTGLVPAVDATIRLDARALARHLAGGGPLPPFVGLAAFDLGRMRGGRLTFTDVARGDDGALVYVACAEDSPDATRDGPVGAVVVGVLPPQGPPRFTPLLGEDGEPCLDKVEGVLAAGPGRLLGVVDRDDVHRPADLLEIAWRPG